MVRQDISGGAKNDRASKRVTEGQRGLRKVMHVWSVPPFDCLNSEPVSFLRIVLQPMHHLG